MIYEAMNHLNVILRLCQRPLSPGTASPAETPKSHAAFLAYIALGARRSVREAARQAHQGSIKTVSKQYQNSIIQHDSKSVARLVRKAQVG